jgi:hypothetical protein
MFVVHDFIYEPLNFQKNMFAIHNFSKKTSNFVIVYPKTLLSMNFTYEPVNIWEKIQLIINKKRSQTSMQPTRRP